MSGKPQAILWLTMDTSGVPDVNDYSLAIPLEVGAILTTFDFQPLGAAYGTVKVTPEHKKGLVKMKEDAPTALKAHAESGLLRATTGDEAVPLIEVEAEILDLLTEQDADTVMLAGFNAGNFLHPVVKEHMPRLAARTSYMSLDVTAMLRFMNYSNPRVAKKLNDKVRPIPESVEGLMAGLPDRVREKFKKILNPTFAYYNFFERIGKQ